MKKLKILVLFGGRSTEHEVSVKSARNVVNALDPKKYDVILVGIGKDGEWHVLSDRKTLHEAKDVPVMIQSSGENKKLMKHYTKESIALENSAIKNVDVIFPVLHGSFGEDGTMQGLLELLDVAYVGPGVLGSAVAMDKDVAKRLWRDAGINVADFLVYKKHEIKDISFSFVRKKLGLPLFVKPSNAGSSVGVSKVRSEKDFLSAIRIAFRYDSKILIEEAIMGREIECSVLGNENPIASLPGEVVVNTDFYSYDAKYIDENGATLAIPAQLSASQIKKIQNTAIQAFQVIGCEGMSRVDFFMTKNGKLYINEINTIPGFTNISMYPKLWEVSGISYSQLLDRLIKLAINRHQRQNRLRRIF